MTDRPDPADAAHWDAVEEATELMHEERFRDALYALRDVAKADPRNPYAYHFMGVALYELGELEPARDAYRAATRLAPAYLGARVNLSHVLRMLGDLRGALAEAQAAQRLAPDDGDVFYALGRAHAAAGNRSVAKRYLEAFLKTNPELEPAFEARQILAALEANSGPLELEDDLTRPPVRRRSRASEPERGRARTCVRPASAGGFGGARSHAAGARLPSVPMVTGV